MGPGFGEQEELLTSEEDGAVAQLHGHAAEASKRGVLRYLEGRGAERLALLQGGLSCAGVGLVVGRDEVELDAEGLAQRGADPELIAGELDEVAVDRTSRLHAAPLAALGDEGEEQR